MTEQLRRGPASHVDEHGKPKVGYLSRRVARAAIRDIRESRGWQLFEYRCGDCPAWHLSKSFRRSEP